MSTLLVTSVGGHLAELRGLLPRIPDLDPDRTWVTFDTPQSRSLLAGEEVVFVDYTAPRDLRNVARHSMLAMRMFGRGHPFRTVLSTGSGIALSFLPLGHARGAACHFIESATRTAGPSLTGRMLRRVPGIVLYSQYQRWANDPWRYAGSVLDGFQSSPRPEPARVRRVLVTLGTMPYGFRRLIERLIAVLPGEAEVEWQVGHTDVEDLPIAAEQWLAARELEKKIAAADVVVAHAGMGSALAALEAGKCPVLVPRLRTWGENIDDHQLQIAAELDERGLAIVRQVEHLCAGDLVEASAQEVHRRTAPLPFQLSHRR